MANLLEGKKILVADDDYNMVDVLVASLAGAGATIETASNGVAAMEKAEEFDPDLVILNVTLPKRSGLLVLEHLKRASSKGNAWPRVIMITNLAGKRHQQWAESLGADAYFRKPIRVERFVKDMERLLAS